jgi:D-arabinose 1-dehydrogenase-like Zn-dependent alcohol dehydrogenase
VCIVGVPDKAPTIAMGPFIMKELKLAGSLIASATTMKQMLEFAALHRIKPMIEPIPFSEAGVAEVSASLELLLSEKGEKRKKKRRSFLLSQK